MRRWIATLFGAGRLPGAPGTWGSLATIFLLFALFTVAGTDQRLLILLAGCLLFSALTVAIGHFALQDFGTNDPSPFVLDEAAGICLTLLFLPIGNGLHLFWPLALGFAAFRLFDVTKPPPARALEKLPGGWGILLDDLAAAVYANLLCQILLRVLFV